MKRVFGLLALLSALATLWLWWESNRLVPRATVLRQVNMGQRGFFTNDARLFVCGDAKQICVYDVLLGQLLATWPRAIHDLKCVMGFHGDRALVAFGTKEEVEVFDLISGQTLGKFSPGQATSLRVSFARNGKFAATLHDEQMILVWEVETGRLFREFRFDESRVRFVQFSPDGARLAVGGQGNAVRVIDLLRGEVTIYSLPLNVKFCWSYFAADGRLLALARINSREYGLWDLTDNRLVVRVRCNNCRAEGDGSYWVVSHHPFESLAALAYMIGAQEIAYELLRASGQGRIFDTRTGQLVASFPARAMDDLAVFPDGKTLATFSYKDGCLRLWDLPPKRAVHPGFVWGAFGLTVVLAAWWWCLPRSDQSRRPGTATSPGLLTSDGKTTA